MTPVMMNRMCYRKLPISTCMDIPDIRFSGFEFVGIQSQNVENGFILSYAIMYYFEIFLAKNQFFKRIHF